MRNPYDFSHDQYRMPTGDEAIQGTNNDAALSRLSAWKMGYINDEYIQYFARPFQRRSPLINRGTYIRYECITRIMLEFISIHDCHCQIVSLGAGSDTRYFTFCDKQMQPDGYYEVDFDNVTRSKVRDIKLSQCLIPKFFPQALITHSEIHDEHYHLISSDLRELSKLDQTLSQYGLDKQKPTLFLSECVLVYMEPEYSDKIIHWAGTDFKEAVFLTYEQILPDDAFGKVMIHNLKMRQVELKGIHKYPTLESQNVRYKSMGWQICECKDLLQIYTCNVGVDEQERIRKLELLDEIEEWNALMKHYCIAMAINSKVFTIKLL